MDKLFERRPHMRKYYENLDDFEDGSRPPVIDWVESLLQGIFAVTGSVMLAFGLFLLIKQYFGW